VPPSLQDLRARPRDREQLLVYADWIQARGDARGELIAVQDLAATTRDGAQFEHARARARTLVEQVEQLRPPLPESGVWAVWERGFVRRLELRFDQSSPGRPNDWAEQLAASLDHASLALIDQLLIRVDLPEPDDESDAALDIAIGGLARWRAAPGPRPSMRLDLHTPRVPRPGAREHLVLALPELRPFWFATDITVIPPLRGGVASGLETALRGANSYGHPLAFDLLWFDSRGHFLARVEAHSLSMDLFDYVSVWQVHVRRLAEQQASPIFDRNDPLVSRRLAHLLDHLAARFDSQEFAPRHAPTVEGLELSDGVARLETRGNMLGVLADAALARFDGHVRWYGVVEPCHESQWTALIGLGVEQVVVLAAAPSE
jgi:uncharacterized protein (TIGR02996 family)